MKPEILQTIIEPKKNTVIIILKLNCNQFKSTNTIKLCLRQFVDSWEMIKYTYFLSALSASVAFSPASKSHSSSVGLYIPLIISFRFFKKIQPLFFVIKDLKHYTTFSQKNRVKKRK